MKLKDLLTAKQIKIKKPELKNFFKEDYNINSSLLLENKRTFDDLQPFQIFLMKFHPLMDEDTTFELKSEEEIKKKKEKILKNYIKVPAIIIKKKNKKDIPIFDILIWNRWNGCGSISGALKMVDVPIWRYFGGDNKTIEGVPPKWFLYMIKNLKSSEDDVLSKNKEKTFFYHKNRKIEYPFDEFLKGYQPNF